jgi:hypothetical protein
MSHANLRNLRSISFIGKRLEFEIDTELMNAEIFDIVNNLSLSKLIC